MNDLVIEDNSVLDKQIINQITNEISYHWYQATTSKKFPMFCHLLMGRNGELHSHYYPFFKMVVDKFCSKHNIKYREVSRACINNTFHIPNYPFRDPHVDNPKEHIVLLMYLNEASIDSRTIIFDIKQDYSDSNRLSVFDLDEYDYKNFPIKKEVTPEFGKIVAFDGKYYHSCRDPKPSENRVVCVFNLLT